MHILTRINPSVLCCFIKKRCNLLCVSLSLCWCVGWFFFRYRSKRKLICYYFVWMHFVHLVNKVKVSWLQSDNLKQVSQCWFFWGLLCYSYPTLKLTTWVSSSFYMVFFLHVLMLPAPSRPPSFIHSTTIKFVFCMVSFKFVLFISSSYFNCELSLTWMSFNSFYYQEVRNEIPNNLNINNENLQSNLEQIIVWLEPYKNSNCI
jgi:hypothetical protein